MQMAWALQTSEGLEVRYLLSCGAHEPFVEWRVPVTGSLPSLAHHLPMLSWYESEMADLFGIGFEHHPHPQSLVLHEGVKPLVPPMLDDGTPLDCVSTQAWLPKQDNPAIQHLPFGPIRADVVESAEFQFLYIGEGILHYHPRLFWKHRGMERRFEGQSAAQGVILAERVSGVGSLAHALAYCQAVEDALGVEVPRRAHWLRLILAELERLYNHLHYFGHLCQTTTLKVGAAQGLLLEERVKQLIGRHIGNRLPRGLLTPGGLRRDLDFTGLDQALRELQRQIESYLRDLENTRSHLDRLITTGPLTRQTAYDQGATGPVERASGIDRDTRRDHPYAAYAELRFDVPVEQAGDAHARAKVRMGELHESLSLIYQALTRLEPGPVRAPLPDAAATAEGLGWVESPRGTLFYTVLFGADGRLARVKIKSPSFSNWRVFPYTVHDTNLMDYAINEASFGLSVAGCDR
ncbi:NADH-quinone oxidoreductase subunit D [Acidihalobacter ferrooxydans]|uniref:NADH-quinone oxidoreductase subunit D n=2 Tax=Acidihalobacter ferrooxydans TaxID=1765967 RepID=A0A1P8UL92_9GAMM|nr:NADH-quinone oxidoreductase subunit D [Acidihalobacter ferrooxydans]